jgi:hypothetical protein
MKAIKILCSLACTAIMITTTSNAFVKDRTTGRGTGPIIYVMNQDMAMLSFGVGELY